MADAYPYPLLVEFDQSDVPRLKIKLTKYFQSKKSNGGECEVEYETSSTSAILRFRTQEVQGNVLAKANHEIVLNNGVCLKMTVRLPPHNELPQNLGLTKEISNKCSAVITTQSSVSEPMAAAGSQTPESTNDDTLEEEPCSTSAVIGNIPETIDEEFLVLLVEHILKDAAGFTLQDIPVISSTVVTFQNAKDSAEFVTRCPKNKMFISKGLTVRPLEITTQVSVEDFPHLDQDFLHMYFEKAGVDVESVQINEEEGSAIISFKDNKAVQKIMKQKLHIQEKEVNIFPYYKSLGLALYGKDRPPLKLPAAVSHNIDTSVWRYLKDHPSAAESICSDLAKHFCDINLDQSTVRLSPMLSLLQQKDAENIVRQWRDSVKSAFVQAVSIFKSIKFKPEKEAWAEHEEYFRQSLQNTGVVLVPDKAGGVLSVVGLEGEVNRLELTLSEAFNKVVGRVQREKSSRSHVIRLVPPSLHRLLCLDGLENKLLSVYPELQMSFKADSSDLTITGLSDEIMEAQKVICHALCQLKRVNLDINSYVLDLLRDEEQEKLTEALLLSNKINAAFELSAQKVQLLAFSDQDLREAEEYLRGHLVCQNLDVEDRKVLETPEWRNLVGQVENTNSELCRRLRVHTTDQKIVVCGHKDSVMKVSSELEDFLKQNATVEEIIVIKPDTIIEYVKTQKSSCLEKVKDRVVLTYKKEAICVSGTRAQVTHCKSLVEGLVSSVIFESFKVVKPGLEKFFRDKESMYLASLFGDTRCLVQLVDNMGDRQDSLTHTHTPKPLYCVQTSDGVEIAVCKADMCSYPVDVVVNSSNSSLQLDAGLAAALLKAAGSQLQVECDKIINLRGQLKPGDCVITDAGGQLKCKKIIHAMGPKFNPLSRDKVLVQLRRAVKDSLELAKSRNYTSVALPAISRGLGFPLDLCAKTITKAVKEHCNEYDDTTLKKIHFVNIDDATVQAMVKAARHVFGNESDTHSPRLEAKATNCPPVKTNGSALLDQNCLGQVKTNEGLDIILTKGKIEEATTEVTVNSIFQDLTLNKGAISNAILRVAGPQLQQLVTDQNPKGSVGEIVVTKGCKLKSEHIFHAVMCQWNGGKGMTEKTFSGIVKSCLDKAEASGLTSISFPAMGTGNLGFPKNLVASLMLKEITTFSSNKPKHLNKVVIILYPGDAQTIQAFSDEFKKEFPQVSVATASTSSLQTQGYFSKVTSNSGVYDTKMGSVQIQVVTGDITNETSDVIVNSSNECFSLKTGVSKAVLDAAGPLVEAECLTLGAQRNTDMVMTQPGKLNCKKILHLVGQTDTVKIKKIIKDALQMCINNSYTSVSFPAIGTGQGNVQAKQVADAMFDAVIDVLIQNPSGPLKTVRIVIFQGPMVKDFHSSMLEREQKEAPKPDDKESNGFWGDLSNSIKSFFGRGPPGKSQKGRDLVTVDVDPTFFHICGDSMADVQLAKQWIMDLVTKEQNNSTVTDAVILNLSDADIQDIVDIQKTMGVSIKMDKIQSALIIEGFSKDVLKANDAIFKMMKKLRDEDNLQKNTELVNNVVGWQYQQQGLQFQSFDPQSNFQLEQAFQNKQPNLKVTVQGSDYTVTLPGGPATDGHGNTLQIKRIDKLKGEELPAHWDPMPPNTSSHSVTIEAGRPEHTEVLSLFQATCTSTVLKIERIQNPVLWRSLLIKKHNMDQRNGHQNNERRLFHGTTHETVTTINEHGFNRSYAGKNAAHYGNGTYFAVNAQYSASNTYSKPNQSGEKCMYLCRVLTGDFTVGKANMITPPARDNSTVHMYDSVVDHQTNPTMFIIFHDTHACPEYLITFK